jgi:hypothetical protein
MEADWEIEVGRDAPIIEAHWSGFVDLRLEPGRAGLLPEIQELPALAHALVRLNAQASPVWTSKCDVFAPGPIDPDELDAPRGCSLRAVACYIDLLPRDGDQWSSTDAAVAACRRVCARLQEIPLRSCRADLVIRRAIITGEEPMFGATAYITAAGRDDADAATTLSAALDVFADAAGTSTTPERAARKLQ